ncbi:hypothetical protein D3C80_1791340 [compost metagenome]
MLLVQPRFGPELAVAHPRQLGAEQSRSRAVGVAVQFGQTPVDADLAQSQCVALLAQGDPAVAVGYLFEVTDQVDALGLDRRLAGELAAEGLGDVGRAQAGTQRQ